MSPRADLLGLYALLVLVRVWRLPLLWHLPTARGADWFFDTQLGAQHPERASLLRRYRAWIVWPTIVVEAIALADVLVFDSVLHIMWLHAPLTWALGFARHIAVRRFVLIARDLGARREPSRFVLSMRSRHLADYTSTTFEIAHMALLLAALAIVVRDGSFRLQAFFLLYCQIGAWLWKIALLRQPVPLPAERAEEYLQLADDAFRGSMRMLDVLRAYFTSAIVLFATEIAWPELHVRALFRFPSALLVALFVLTVWMLVAQSRRTRTLLSRAREIGVTPARRKLADPENLALGGFVYRNAENPAVVVDGGPLRFALNVRNAATYFYLGYWTGFAVLAAFLGAAS